MVIVIVGYLMTHHGAGSLGDLHMKWQSCRALNCISVALQDPEGFQGGVWNSFADVMAIYHKKHSVRRSKTAALRTRCDPRVMRASDPDANTGLV